MSSIRLAFVCLLSLCLAISVSAQGEAEKVPSLQDAKTFDEVFAYFNHEELKLYLNNYEPKKRAEAIADLLIQASDKLLEIAETAEEKQRAYVQRYNAFAHLIFGEVEGAEQKMEAFLKELAAKEETKEFEESFRLSYLLLQMRVKGFKETEQKIEVFLTELAAKEKTETRTQLLRSAVSRIISQKFETALQNKVPAEQTIKEWNEYFQSPQRNLPAEVKKEIIAALDARARLLLGADPKLYGRTLDDKDFKWESLRGKYVLIKFTATWCGPCKAQIPAMLEAYEKHHDKGLEIVSVYMWEHGADPVATVKESIEKEKLPWIILSEALSEKANHPKYEEFYAINGVPTIVLVDKEGKIVMPASHNDGWKTKLEEIFDSTE